LYGDVTEVLIIPNVNVRQRCQKWIEEHPEAYERMKAEDARRHTAGF
jgi:hypothetical protein